MECECGTSAAKFKRGSGYAKCPKCGKRYKIDEFGAGDRYHPIKKHEDSWEANILGQMSDDRRKDFMDKKKQEILSMNATRSVKRKLLEKWGVSKEEIDLLLKWSPNASGSKNHVI